MYTLNQKVIRVYWSRQHGAYITLISSWIIAVILTGYSLVQALALIFLLSSVNFIELLSEKLFRKSALPEYKNLWLFVYGLASSLLGVFLLIFSKTFQYLIIYLLIASVLFLWTYKERLQKKLIPELATFAFFVLSSFIGSTIESWNNIIPAMVVMALYFGSSVFTVKERFGKLSLWPLIVYLFLSADIILLLYNVTSFGLVVILLMILKTSGPWAFKEQFNALPIQKIGIIEIVFQLSFILSFLLLYNS
jgi:hypothetical protein